MIDKFIRPSGTEEQHKVKKKKKLVLTNAQTTAFFEDNDQMAIPHNTVIHLVIKGILTVDDLEDFQKTDIKQIAANLRRPIVPRALLLVLGAKSVKRMTAACKLV
eukprot:9024529-Ditylum_brightwellii.AAC.1